jgi:Domain of unknown function (DUF4331)
MKKLKQSFASTVLYLSLILVVISSGAGKLRAASPAEGSAASNDPAADIGNVYLFLDPTDNTRVVVAMTVRGFIVPAQAVNQGTFDPNVRYQFQIEGTGDAAPDAVINVTFSKRSDPASPQLGSVKMIQGTSTIFDFIGPATNPTLNAASAQVITTDGASGVKFFAGEVDDPFFFDIPAFSRYIESYPSMPSAGSFTRARDSFAGYNTLAISLSIPKALLPASNNVVGASAATFRLLPALANIATRGVVEGGDSVLIAGTIVTGNVSKRVAFRAIGPTLAASGVPNALSDPVLTVRTSQGQLVATNDNWQQTQGSEISAAGLAPGDARESAIIATLAPGAYTAVVEGAGGATGNALVEVYDLQSTPQIGRMGVPLISFALVPFSRKDEYNSAITQDDAAGRFDSDIVASLTALQTGNSSIQILRSMAVTKGDMLRLSLNVPNTGNSGGTNAPAAFPNGRRPADDVIDTLLTLINNQNSLGDAVNGNDVPFQNNFPFFATPQQPRNSGVLDDNTRN